MQEFKEIVNGIPKNILNKFKGLSDWSILVMFRGSIAHGMYMPNSDPNSIDDVDLMSVCAPPIDYYFGSKMYGSRSTLELKCDPLDIVIYEVKKVISLLSKGNPNVLMILWLKDKYFLKKTKAGQMLLDNRDLFVGKHVHKSFMGYANGQLKRMQNFSYNGYMGKKRKQLVEKFGYDIKNAAHLIRLLRMGIEFLKDGTMQIERKDTEELLQIKRGEWSLDKIKKEADKLFVSAKKAYERSNLPLELDLEKIDELSVKVIKQALRERETKRKDL